MSTKCEICSKKFKNDDLMPIEILREPLVAEIIDINQNYDPAGFVCKTDLKLIRKKHYEKMIINHPTFNSDKLIESLSSKTLFNDKDIDDRTTFGEKVSDKLASFGGSWLFIGIFTFVLIAWIILNVKMATTAPDPYPFILLNLILSCLAAIQAPVILMSSNRQAQKDRIKLEQDHDVNLKAEIEIMSLHEKVDNLAKAQIKILHELKLKK